MKRMQVKKLSPAMAGFEVGDKVKILEKCGKGYFYRIQNERNGVIGYCDPEHLEKMGFLERIWTGLKRK